MSSLESVELRVVGEHGLAVEPVGVGALNGVNHRRPGAGAVQNYTRGLTACAGEAQETNTVRDGSSPQVRWICSGVPSA